MANPITICTAVRLEAVAIARRLRCHQIDEACWHKDHVRIVNIGIRAGKLAAREAMVLHTTPALLIMAGLAAGLVTDLCVGHVVLDPQDLPRTGLTPGELPPHLRIHLGPIVSTPEILCTADEKRALAARSRAVAADMETDIVRQFALQQGLRFLALRAISDDVEDCLPRELPRLVDIDGRPRTFQLASALVCRPGLLRQLTDLRRNSQQACDRLGEVLEWLTGYWGKRKLETPL